MALFYSLSALSVAQTAAPICDSISESVELKGTIQKMVFPGPPNYLSIKSGDAPEKVNVLVLPQTKCKAYENHFFYVQLIQLVGLESKVESYAGREVFIQGKVFWAETGHHHTPIMLSVAEVQGAL